MNTVFSLRLWLIFLRRIMLSCYPAEVAFLLFSRKTFARIKESRALRVVLVFIVCDLAVRAVVFFAGVPFSGRYFLPWTVGFALLAGGGFEPLAEFAATRTRVSKNIVGIVVFCAIAIGYSIKALHPRKDKPWLQAIPAKIRSLTPEEMEPVIISNYMDGRFGFYADTSRLILLQPEKEWALYVQRRRCGGDVQWSQLKRDVGLKGLRGLVFGLNNQRVFIILRVDSHGASSDQVAELESLSCLRVVESYADRKGRRFKLYAFSNSND